MLFDLRPTQDPDVSHEKPNRGRLTSLAAREGTASCCFSIRFFFREHAVPASLFDLDLSRGSFSRPSPEGESGATAMAFSTRLLTRHGTTLSRDGETRQVRRRS